MKTSFLPNLQRMPGLGAAIQGIGGLAQTVIGGISAAKNQKKLESLINGYQPNGSIMDYYSKALNRYNLNPYQSNAYKMATQSAQKGLATGINALQDRRSALAGIGSLVQGYSDNATRAAAMAENQQAQALGQLGQATGMKAQEERYPFELKANLLAQKASGNNQVMNAGLQNVFGAGSSLSQMEMLNKMYGDGGSGTKSKGGFYNTKYGKLYR